MHCLTAIYDGGQETFLVKTFRYIQNSSKNKYNFTICSLSHSTNKALIDKYHEAGIKYYSFNFANRKRSLKDIFRNIKELFKLSKLIKKEKIDILYGHDFFSALIVRLSRIFSFIFFFYRLKRVYISIHLLFFWLKKKHHILNKILSYFTDKVICVSNSVYKYSLKHDKIQKDKYIVIYNGIDVDEFSFSQQIRNEFRRKFGIDDSTIVFGAVGNISPRKGQLILAKAFNEVNKIYPDSILLLFGSCRGVDREEDYKKELDLFINNYKLENLIRIYDPRLDINNIFTIFDFFVMPSLVEGFGLVLAEAMSTERIVIASKIPPFKEIVDDGIDGFLFETENYVDLIEKMKMVLKLKDSELGIISGNARRKIIEHFNSNNMGKEYEKLYNI